MEILRIFSKSAPGFCFELSLVMNKVTKDIQSEAPYGVFFLADDIVLIGKNLKKVNSRLEEWREALKSRRLAEA